MFDLYSKSLARFYAVGVASILQVLLGFTQFGQWRWVYALKSGYGSAAGLYIVSLAMVVSASGVCSILYVCVG